MDELDPTPDDLARWADDAARRASREADAYEIRAELSRNRKTALDAGALSALHASRIAGVAIKVVVGGGSGFAATHDPSPASIDGALDRAVRMARANAARGRGLPPAPGTGRSASYAADVRGHPRDATPDDYLALLRRACDAAAEAAGADARVAAAFGAQDRRVVRLDSDGGRLHSDTLLSTLFVNVVRKGSRLADGVEWRSGERGLADYEDDGGPEAVGRAAARFAAEAAEAEPAPVGRMRVLCDNHLSGLLAHESFGHLTEADLVKMGWSVLAQKRGERFAGEHVSVIDAHEVPGRPRDGVRVPFDEEGTPGRALRILDRGVLRGFMHQRASAQADGDAPTGNGRALSVRHPPIVRMRNTFFEPGTMPREEALEALGDGVYLLGGRGGAPASDGSFMFTAVRGYRVKGGRIEAPIRSTAISGNILEFLAGVEAVTRDFEVRSTYFGGCGKWDQSFLHVGMGGPHVLVRDALVGGEAA